MQATGAPAVATIGAASEAESLVGQGCSEEARKLEIIPSHARTEFPLVVVVVVVDVAAPKPGRETNLSWRN